jgi:Dolichyl-phosphate-mannose-protein mannosyltransferase
MTAELPPSQPSSQSSRSWLWGALLVPVLGAAASLAVSWQCWINPLIDSPREMAVASRIAAGQHLYSDVVYYYGPVGPWLCGLAVALFGQRFVVLEILAGVVSTLLLALLFVLTRRAGSTGSAVAATAAAATICWGAPNGGAFIFPYASASLFALAAALLALVAASGRRTLANRLLLMGSLTLALLSRAEIGGAAVVALLLAALRSDQPRRSAWSEAAAVLGASLAAAAIYALAFAGASLHDLVADGPLKHYLGLSNQWRMFYLRTAGLTEPMKRLGQLSLGAGLDLLLLAAAAAIAAPAATMPRLRRWLFPLLVGGLLVAYGASPFNLTGRNLPPLWQPLPLVAAGAALWLLRRPLDARSRARFVLFALSAIVASRVAFNLTVGPRMSPYCAVPLPGLLAVAAVLFADIAAVRIPAPGVFRRRLAAILVTLMLLYLYRLERFHQRQHLVRLETAAGALRLPAREALPISYALSYLSTHARPGETLVGFPESGFFNFIVALRNPLRLDQIMPGQLDPDGERKVAHQVAAEGPQFIVLCNRPTPEYGAVAFGRDYADQLWEEVRSHYGLAATFGARADTPVGAQRFFVRIYERTSQDRSAPLLLARLARAGDGAPSSGRRFGS